jgi:hypothetical protein
MPFGETIAAEKFGWWLYAYANLKQLLDANGDTAEASRLQAQMEAQMVAMESRYPQYALIHDQVRATLLAQAGRAEEACAALERVYTPAPRLYWWMVLSNPAFDSTRAKPCFKTLLTRLNAHVAAERERVEKMRHAGQIPDRRAANPARGDEPTSAP